MLARPMLAIAQKGASDGFAVFKRVKLCPSYPDAGKSPAIE